MATVRRQYKPTADEVALREWLKTELTRWQADGVDVNQFVLYANGGGKRPDDGEFITMQVVSSHQVGLSEFKTDAVQVGSDPVIYTRSQISQVTGLVSVNVLGLDHRVIARTIVARIEDPFVRLALDALGLVIYQASDTRDLTAPDEGNPLGRSQIDFNFRYLEKMTVHAGAIKEVAATGMLVAGAHIISWEDTIDADDPTGLGDD